MRPEKKPSGTRAGCAIKESTVWQMIPVRLADPVGLVLHLTQLQRRALAAPPVGYNPKPTPRRAISAWPAPQVEFARTTRQTKRAKNVPKKLFSPNPDKPSANHASLRESPGQLSARAARLASLVSKTQTEAGARTASLAGGHMMVTRSSAWNVQRVGMRMASRVAAQTAPVAMPEPGATKRPLRTTLRVPAARLEPSLPCNFRISLFR